MMDKTNEIQRYVALKRDGRDEEATIWVDGLLKKYKDDTETVELLAVLILILK